MYVLFSSTSRNSSFGIRPVATYMTASSIIEAAAHELAREGGTLENLGGIRWIEDADGNSRPEREITPEERLELSIQKLGDDGRLFEAFDDNSAAEFIDAAKRYGLDDEARALVESFK